MVATSDRILGAQRALLQTSQDVGLRTLDGVARLFEINVQATRTLLAAGADRLGSTAQPDAAGAAAAGLLFTQSGPNAAASYLRQVTDLASSTGMELAHLLQEQAIALQSLISELTAAVWQTRPINTDAFVAMMRNPLGAAQSVVQSTTGATSRSAGAAGQAADTVA